MSRALSTLLILVALLAAAATPTVAREPEETAPPLEGEVIPGEVIVSYRGGFVADASQVRGLELVQRLGDPASSDASSAPALLSTGGRSVAEVLGELRADPSVLVAEPNYRVYLADEGTTTGVAVNDPKTTGQYSLDRMRVRDAWSRTKGGSNLVAVLDTGVQSNHPDLVGRVAKGRDFVNDDTNAADDNGHGTWVAGIIAANTNDGFGIAGISWTDRILPVKIMNSQGTGNTADLLAAIRWSADKGADVINMSVGGFPYSQQLQDAVNYAHGKGAVLVGAAGNNRREENFYPASFDNVISVSATQPQDEFSNWSSYGPKVDVSAPGSSVLTTNCAACKPNEHDMSGDNRYTYISGTSFATPNVAGVVALIRAKYPSYTPYEVAQRLFTTVDDLGSPGWDKRYGRGRVNAHRAVGGWEPAASVPAGDPMEGNNVVTSNAPELPLGSTARPSIYPAGDVDVFSVDVPRGGRLDVRVSGIVDSRAYPWHRSGLPIDPIVELYTGAGALIKRVDNVWEGGTELAAVHVPGSTRILVRIFNWYPSGNRAGYTVTPTFVDTVKPVATIAAPAAAATDVSRFVDPIVTFSERVTGASSENIRLRDMVANTVVPAKILYDAAARRARLAASDRLLPGHVYRFEVSAGIRDAGGNPIAATRVTFTTGTASFVDTGGTTFETEIEWLLASGITGGCSSTAFCPTAPVKREQAASFLARAMGLPASPSDYFTDDAESAHQGDINRLANAAVTSGCAPTRFCPSATMTRGQMASFLARALALPDTEVDHFADDDGSTHENAINRLADARIVGGCGADSFCPTSGVTREQMAAFLYRAFRD